MLKKSSLPAAALAINRRQVGGEHYLRQRMQHWDYILANQIPYMEAQIIKYCSRWRDKGGLQDLRKAQHFLDKLIEYETLKIRSRVKNYAISSGHSTERCSALPERAGRASGDYPNSRKHKPQRRQQ